MNKKQWDVEMFEYYQNQLQQYQNEINTCEKQLYHNNNTIQKQKKQIKLLTNKISPNLCVICLDSQSKNAIVPCGHLSFCKNCFLMNMTSVLNKC